ncbi:hypothetical protein LguiB_003267 [Lonicera macranthoides]
MEQWKVDLVHTLGEGNRCADKLIKVGVGQPILVPPPEVIEDLKADTRDCRC